MTYLGELLVGDDQGLSRILGVGDDHGVDGDQRSWPWVGVIGVAS